MTARLMSLLRCPVTGARLQLQVFDELILAGDSNETVTEQGLLISPDGLLFPVINRIPRMTLDAFLEYEDFLRNRLADYEVRKTNILASPHAPLLANAAQMNRRTRLSFEYEWSKFDPATDRTWDEDRNGMISRFFRETGLDSRSIRGRLIFDAGCGNGLLDQYLAGLGAEVIAMDLTRSVERAAASSAFKNAMYVQGDVLHPPFARNTFDLVHSSGVLVAVADPETAFKNLVTFLAGNGIISIWLYHPQKDIIHNWMLTARKFVVRLPSSLQRAVINFGLLPLSFVVKKLKGNRQNIREMRVDLLDHFTPEHRWELTHDEAMGWFVSAGLADTSITTKERFGFNITGRNKAGARAPEPQSKLTSPE